MKTRTDLLIFLRPFRILFFVTALLMVGPGQGHAQDNGVTADNQKINRLTLEARLTKEGQTIENGLEWRIFGQNLGADGKLPLLAEAFGGTKTFDITQGDYLVHVAYGHAALVRKVSVAEASTVVFELNAGGLKLDAIAAIDTPIPAKYLKFDVYDSEQNEFGERKMIARAVNPGEVIPFPAGTYHVISRFGETNAEIGADLRVQPGKVTAANLEHHAAVLTFRLVSSAGGDAIADTSWSILTESGDLITESRSTFPTMVLAEGSYSAIAKHKGTIYSTNFEVKSGVFGDIEVLAIN